MTYSRSLKAFVILLCLGALILVGHILDWNNFSAEKFEVTVQSWGNWGVVGSIGLMILHSFVPFPAGFLAMANGMVFGPIMGVAVTWVGAMLGAFLAFGLTRAFGRSFVNHMVSRNKWKVFDDWTSENITMVLLLSRFIPVIAFNLINYAAGLTRASTWTFTWTTAIGILPGTVFMVVMGDQVGNMDWKLWISLFGVVAGLFFLFRRKFAFTKNFRKPTLTGNGPGNGSKITKIEAK